MFNKTKKPVSGNRKVTRQVGRKSSGQAMRGEKVKKRNFTKIANRFKEFLVLLWRPKLISSVSVLVFGLFIYENVNMDNVLPIKFIKIEGEFAFLNKDQLERQTIPVLNGGFFNVNLANIRNELVGLPWVEDVSVRRQWPDSLQVRVIEQKPVVLWGEKALISAKGKLFEPSQKPALNLPQLSGPQGQHEVMLKELARMQAWLLETGLHIKRIELNARRSWILTMTTGMQLRLGREQMHERLNRFVSVYKETLEAEVLKKSAREIKYIDMRYTNGLAVAWNEA
jgi:cell division protein FtsQ